MFCCIPSLPEQKEERPVIVDLEEIIKDRAWKIWSSGLSCCQRIGLKRRNFIIEVPRNYYVFEDVTDTKINAAMIKAPDMTHMAATKEKSHETVTIETRFNNDTALAQTYTFRFEKNRRTEVNVSFQKGFTFGTSTNFKVGLPQIFGSDAGAEVGASSEYQVTSEKGQTFEESVTMEATSEIIVKERSCYIADVQLNDIHVMKPFRSITRLRLPQGYAPVYIKQKKTQKVVGVYDVRGLYDIFQHCACIKHPTIPEPVFDDYKGPNAKSDGAEIVDGENNETKAEPKTNGNTVADDQTATEDMQLVEREELGEYGENYVDFYTEGYVEGTFACNHEILLRNVDPNLDRKAVTTPL